MICERCGNDDRGLYFFVPDQAAWDRLSPYGDARGKFCLFCCDELAAQAGLYGIPVEIGFSGRALFVENAAAYSGMVRAGYGVGP